jgi:hypothetical protein
LQEPKEHGEKFYKVRLVEDGKGELSAKKEQLSRQRNVLSKQSIRQYIKDSASKDSHLNSPWIIKPELAEKFQISTAAQPADVLWDEKEKRWRIKVFQLLYFIVDD